MYSYLEIYYYRLLAIIVVIIISQLSILGLLVTIMQFFLF